MQESNLLTKKLSEDLTPLTIREITPVKLSQRPQEKFIRADSYYSDKVSPERNYKAISKVLKK